MSTRKRPLSELSQPLTTPSRRQPSTPGILQATQSRTGARSRSTRPLSRNGTNAAQPTSARGILRRLAKITAPITKRRVITPASTYEDKENLRPDDEDERKDLEKPKLNFTIEESLEEDDSELPVAPTPSALLEDTDDEDFEQPTITFHNLEHSRSAYDTARRKSRLSLLPHSESELQDEQADEDEGQSTFLTERGRRAISEEPTRMSRYSFGSIRMSEFGSELEIRRDSDRQQKLAALDNDDYYGTSVNKDHFGGETEHLRNLRPSSPPTFVSTADESIQIALEEHDTFQLDIPDVVEEEDVIALERGVPDIHPQLADTILVEDEETLEGEAEVPATVNSRRQTLLESVVATAKPRSRKRLKINQRGNMIPSLPSSLIKRIVHDSQEKANKRKTTLGKDHMRALEQATEWFFEQIGEDLEAYSGHSRRKKRVDTDDVLLLMRRQRVLGEEGDLRQLAKDWLPRDMLNDLDLPGRP